MSKQDFIESLNFLNRMRELVEMDVPEEVSAPIDFYAELADEQTSPTRMVQYLNEAQNLRERLTNQRVAYLEAFREREYPNVSIGVDLRDQVRGYERSVNILGRNRTLRDLDEQRNNLIELLQRWK